MFGFYDKYFLLFGLKVSYYGVLIAVGMALGVFVACRLARRRGLKSEDVLLVACYVIPLAIIGARLYYVAFSGQTFTFWQIFEIWKGGMAVYGGIIGGVVGVGLYCLIHKKNFFAIADIAVAGLALGQGIGRIGCYLSECCYGIEVTNPSLQWFPLSTQINGTWHLSTFFYESFCDLILFVVLYIMASKRVRTRGVVMSVYLMGYGTIRCIIEGFRGDSLYFLGMRVSQLLSGIIIAIGVGFLIFFLVRAHRQLPMSDKTADKKE